MKRVMPINMKHSSKKRCKDLNLVWISSEIMKRSSPMIMRTECLKNISQLVKILTFRLTTSNRLIIWMIWHPIWKGRKHSRHLWQQRHLIWHVKPIDLDLMIQQLSSCFCQHTQATCTFQRIPRSQLKAHALKRLKWVSHIPLRLLLKYRWWPQCLRRKARFAQSGSFCPALMLNMLKSSSQLVHLPWISHLRVKMRDITSNILDLRHICSVKDTKMRFYLCSRQWRPSWVAWADMEDFLCSNQEYQITWSTQM